MLNNDLTKTIRIKTETLLRLYSMKAMVGTDEQNNVPTLDTVINAGLDAYQHLNSTHPPVSTHATYNEFPAQLA